MVLPGAAAGARRGWAASRPLAADGGGDRPLLLRARHHPLPRSAVFVDRSSCWGRTRRAVAAGAVARTGSRELFTLSVLAVALGIASARPRSSASRSRSARSSPASCSASRSSATAAEDSLPLQDAFAVLFFVAVGMLFDPASWFGGRCKVLARAGDDRLGKSLSPSPSSCCWAIRSRTGADGLGEPRADRRVLVHPDALGITLGLVPGEVRDLVVAGALFSIMLNPLVFHLVGRVERRLAAAVPRGAAFYGQRHYEALGRALEAIKARNEERTRAEELKLQSLLERFPVLRLVEHRGQEALLLMFRPKSASPGEKVIRRGDRGDAMYFISSGAVEVKVDDSRTVRLEAGAYFGEMALLTGERRTADVIAVDFCQFLVLDQREFNQFMARHPALRAAVAGIAEERRTMNLAPPVDESPADEPAS